MTKDEFRRMEIEQMNSGGIREGYGSQASKLDNSVAILKSAADGFATKSVQAYASGDKTQGDRYLSYAADYYKAAGDAQQSVNDINLTAPKFQLPPAAVGSPASDLKFELKLGGAAYAIVGGNLELTADINVSRPSWVLCF